MKYDDDWTPPTCECGCGTPVLFHGRQPRRFVKGHAHRTTPAYVVDEASGCWVWQRTRTSHGYGTLMVERKRWRAHRWYYLETHGWVPEMLDHICRNRACVNPAHLRPTDNAQNQQNRGGIEGKGPRGVTYDRVRNAWIAAVKLNGQRRFIGRFATESEAAAAAADFRAEHMPYSPEAMERAA